MSHSFCPKHSRDHFGAASGLIRHFIYVCVTVHRYIHVCSLGLFSENVSSVVYDFLTIAQQRTTAAGVPHPINMYADNFTSSTENVFTTRMYRYSPIVTEKT